jgi:predicted RNase H-like nuclease (RuvC/YqgF family)
MASVGGHDIRFVQGQANMVEMGASRVELQIEGAPGVAVELKRNDVLFPTVGVIQRLENQVTRLPDEVVKRERQLEEARQECRDAANALKQPFKHTDALQTAKWEVERINREMRGEDGAQTVLTAELEELRRDMRLVTPTAERSGSPVQLPPSQQSDAVHRTKAASRDGGMER